MCIRDRLSYDVRGNIESFLLPQQSQHMDYIILEYEKHAKPKVSDYNTFNCMIPSEMCIRDRVYISLLKKVN